MGIYGTPLNPFMPPRYEPKRFYPPADMGTQTILSSDTDPALLGAGAMYPSHGYEQPAPVAQEPQGASFEDTLAALQKQIAGVEIPSAASVAELQKIGKLNPFGFSDPEGYVQGKNKQLDRLMMGLQQTLSAKRKNKISIPEVIQALLAVSAGVRGLTSDDTETRNMGIQQALGGLQAIKQDRANRAAADADEKKQAVELAKLFEEVISGQSNRAISAAQTGNAAKQGTINNYNEQTFGLPLEKAKADLAKLGLEHEITKNRMSENSMTLQELKDKRKYGFYTQSITPFVQSDGKVDTDGFLDWVEDYHPEMLPDMMDLTGRKEKDTTDQFLKDVESFVKETYMVDILSADGKTTVRGVYDPDNLNGPPIPPTDNRFPEALRRWHDEAGAMIAQNRQKGKITKPRIGDENSVYFKDKERKEAEAMARERERAFRERMSRGSYLERALGTPQGF